MRQVPRGHCLCIVHQQHNRAPELLDQALDVGCRHVLRQKEHTYACGREIQVTIESEQGSAATWTSPCWWGSRTGGRALGLSKMQNHLILPQNLWLSVEARLSLISLSLLTRRKTQSMQVE